MKGSKNQKRNTSGASAPHKGREKRRAAASRKARRRKRLLLIFYLVTFLIAIGAAVVLSITVLFRIDTIQVTGQSRYTEQEIVQMSGIEVGENLFLADTATAKQQIEEKLPYIGRAKVSRRLPAKILITVEEAEISGAVEYGGGYAIVSPEGKVLEITSAIPEGYSLIEGLDLKSADLGKKIVYEDPEKQEMFTELAQSLAEHGIAPITRMDLTNLYDIVVEYDGRITMEFGLPSDIDFKVRFAKTILSEPDMAEAQGVLDLSYCKESNRANFEENASREEPESSSEEPQESAPESSSAAAE
ncbi:MAG TPA: FtsQ-type POTRA domain-containing protein [Candidatus Gallacutalibacter pullicola]|uniref:FtsQ-type POTRA domain-containing protein n=1 Tax=Candidatus Gallacutalibacter pullicola TaxID=2840830 RepID=A0A9D1J162_9FIRM|nr:FtsQ-type POTRA domain-containing protein [Candidatus Gallacutalibacter pullicola]